MAKRIEYFTCCGRLLKVEDLVVQGMTISGPVLGCPSCGMLDTLKPVVVGFVAVKFDGGMKTYDYCTNIELKTGDRVLVETPDGHTEVTVSHTKKEPGMAYKWVVKKIERVEPKPLFPDILTILRVASSILVPNTSCSKEYGMVSDHGVNIVSTKFKTWVYPNGAGYVEICTEKGSRYDGIGAVRFGDAASMLQAMQELRERVNMINQKPVKKKRDVCTKCGK